MKRLFALLLSILLMLSLCACNTKQATTEPPATTMSTQETTVPTIETTVPATEPPETPANVLDLAQKAVHDELFREQNEQTLKIVNRLFKHLEYAVIDSQVDGDEAMVTMWIMNINAGAAWQRTLTKYASISAENMFTNKQMNYSELYDQYLEELEDAFKAADYVIIPVVVEMELEDYQWMWDFDEDVINAISGNLLAAIEGDLDDLLRAEFVATLMPEEAASWVWNLDDILSLYEKYEIKRPTQFYIELVVKEEIQK